MVASDLPRISGSTGRNRYAEIRQLLLARQAKSAATVCRRAMAISPNDPVLLHFAALAALQSGDLSRARMLLRRCLDREPNYGPALQDMGNCYLLLSRYDEAREAYETALACGQRSAVLLTNLGLACMRQGDSTSGEACLKAALLEDSSHVEAWTNLAVAALKSGALQQSLAYYLSALKHQPDNAAAALGLAALYDELGQRQSALDIRRKLATKQAPDDPSILRLYLRDARRACLWAEVERIEGKLERILGDAGLPVWHGEDPLESCIGYADPARNLAAARERSAELEARMGPPLKRRRPRGPRRERIRIGYLFADVCGGPGAQLTRRMFALHDRNDFEVSLYASRSDETSDEYQDIKSGCDRFVDCRDWSDRQLAQAMVTDEIDILIDLDGWTQHNRLGAAAFRPCEVQITYLGCPASTGADFMDYVITDGIVVPTENRQFLSEAPVVMPDCYMVTDNALPTASRRPHRLDCGLPENGIVFCCFSQPHKIDQTMFACWMRILRQVDESVLWLWDSTGLAEANLRAEAAAHGVAPSRLIIAERKAKPDHLRRLELADIALDTRIYNGHTTTVDLLWAGVPVVALTGSHWASRVSTSILSSLGLPEFAVDSEQAYEELALRLAREPDFLAATKGRIARQRTRSSLFDPAGFVRHLDLALRAIWLRHLSGSDPAALMFDADGAPYFDQQTTSGQ